MRLTSFLNTLVVATAMVGCTMATGPERLTILNATPMTVGYIALDQELATRTDPNPKLPTTALGGRILSPNQEATVLPAQIEGYREGMGVAFFIYRVSGDSASFATSVVAPETRPTGRSYRVTIPAEAVRP